MRWKILGAAVFAMLIAGFTLINNIPVTVHFLFATTSVNLVLVILGSVLLGMILMAILWSIRAWQLRSQAGNLRREVRRLTDEVAVLQKQLDESFQRTRQAAAAEDDGEPSVENEESDYNP